jgi:nitroimidazol reductase NimA-like FMN-containing flavoprotein (pyridoxamine 5'-phosphate oxidase superfamily)
MNGTMEFQNVDLFREPLQSVYSIMIQRSQIRRSPERAVPARAAQILAEGQVAHVGFVEGGQPFVIPLGYHFSQADPERLYVHGAPASRVLRHLASGAPVCITVTLLDGLVYSRTAMNHCMNYRSVVCFGRGQLVTEPAVQRRVYEAMISRYFPGRMAGRDYSEPTAAHLEATSLVELHIEEWSAKSREGGPNGPLDGLEDAPGTRGVAEP